MKLNRFQAFGWHLLASATVALISTAVIFLVWYPWPLPVATGVLTVFLVVVGVDVVIGPCITLIVFKPGKKGLKFDMSVIALMQLAALIYGLHAVFVARPVYFVFNADRFDLVYANELSAEKRQKVADPKFQSIPLLGPEVIAARSPAATEAKNQILFNALSGGDDLPQMPQYYVPYADSKEDVKKRMLPLEELKKHNKERVTEIDALIKQYASTGQHIRYLPLRGKVADLAVFVDEDTAAVLKVMNFKPWRY